MSNVDEDISVYSGQYEVEVSINSPLARVWDQYLDIASWVTSHQIEDVHGQPGTLGSITRVTSLSAIEQGAPAPQYHFCKIIKLIPQKHYVLKTYSEKGGSYGLQIAAFDDARFFEVNGVTRVVFNLYAEFKGEAVAQDPSAMGKVMEGSRDGMAVNLEKLKHLVEARGSKR